MAEPTTRTGREAEEIRRLASRLHKVEQDNRELRARLEAMADQPHQRMIRTLLNATFDALFVMKPDGTVVDCNEALLQRLGCSRDELIGADVYDYLDGETAATRREVVARVLETGRAERFVDRRGNRLIDQHVVPVIDDAGQPSLLAIYAADITDRSVIRDALQHQAQQTQQYLNVAGVLFVALDRRGRIEMVNPKAAEVLGWSPQELKGRDWFSTCLPEADREEVRSVFTRLINGELDPLEYLEGAVLTRDGQERTIRWHNALLCDAQGRITGTLSSGNDVTAERRAEQALRASEERLRTLYESVHAGVIVQSVDGTIVHANRVAAEIFQMPPGGMEGRTSMYTGWHMIDEQGQPVPGEQHPSMVTLRTGEPIRDVVRGIYGDSPERTRWLLISTEPLRDPATGEMSEVLVTFSDINAQKRAESELARYRDHLEKLVDERTAQRDASREMLSRSERLAALGTFAAGIAHEINNPVGMMQLAAEFALTVPDNPRVTADSLKDVIANAKRTKRIMQGVLSFARQDTSLKSPCDLNRLIEMTIALIRNHAVMRGCDITLNLADHLPPILANETGMEQALLNVVRNAVEARAQHVVVETQSLNGQVGVAVVDDGNGIPDNIRRYVFDPFFSQRQEEGGVGLGLSITHRIIQDHHGQLELDSRPNEGTRVRICLPTVSNLTQRGEHHG